MSKKCKTNITPTVFIKKSLSVANKTQIAQDSHKLFTIKQSKIPPFDEKRFILEDGIHSGAYGHFKNEEN